MADGGLPLIKRIANTQRLFAVVALLWEANTLASQKHPRKARKVALKAIPELEQIEDYDWRWSNGAEFVKGAIENGHYYFLWSRLQGDLEYEIALLTTNRGRFMVNDPTGLFRHYLVGGLRGLERWEERGSGDTFYQEALGYVRERIDGGVDTIGTNYIPDIWHWWIESKRNVPQP